MLLHYDEFASPIGRILFASDARAICALDFEEYQQRMKSLLTRRFERLVFQRDSAKATASRPLAARTLPTLPAPP